jgi:hypothetical protein
VIPRQNFRTAQASGSKGYSLKSAINVLGVLVFLPSPLTCKYMGGVATSSYLTTKRLMVI